MMKLSHKIRVCMISLIVTDYLIKFISLVLLNLGNFL